VRIGFKSVGWQSAVGSSGTIRAVGEVLRARPGGDGAITSVGVESLIAQCLRAGHISRVKLPGLTEERAPVFVGGLAILAELLSVLEIQTLRVADGALREGLLYDLVGRLTDEDARVRSVRAMQARFHVEVAQAERVEATALDFLRQIQLQWELTEPLAESVLRWAARLHEIGLDVSHSHYQKHGAYLLEHADMPGFPQEEQRILACIVGAHRRKFQSDKLQDLSPPWHLRTEYLIVILRLAVMLHRGRSPIALAEISFEIL
jgi:exopolyphosphatase/guanosine-5'-triphosphate,3'-diphosphate pyrophosphatase